MANTSLHTKYRPRNFEEILGHEPIVNSLKNVIADDRNHAFIFTGPSGVGKTTLARIIANELTGGIAAATNLIEIDAATHTGVDAMRAVTSSAQYRAIGSSPVKAIVVDKCHKLSAGAFNSLLKVIEEPPTHVYWFLCTTDFGKIPKTIQTRCLTYNLSPLEELDLFTLLTLVAAEEQMEVSDEILEAIAESSQGSPRQALVFMEACCYCETANEALRIMRAAGQQKEVVDLCRFLIRGRGRTWAEAVKHLAPLSELDAESIRIMIVNYFAKALLGTNGNDEALRLFKVLEEFEEPFLQSDKHAPLLLAVGRAIEI